MTYGVALAQHVSEKRTVELPPHKISLISFFQLVEKKYPDMSFSYKTDLVEGEYLIGESNGVYTVKEVLYNNLSRLNLKYKNVNGHIIVYKVKPEPESDIKEQIVTKTIYTKETLYDTVITYYFDTVKTLKIDTVTLLDTLKVYDTIAVKEDIRRAVSLSVYSGMMWPIKPFPSIKNDYRTLEIEMSTDKMFGCGLAYEIWTWAVYSGFLYTENTVSIKESFFYSNYIEQEVIDEINYEQYLVTDTLTSYFEYTDIDTTWRYITKQRNIENIDTIYKTTTLEHKHDTSLTFENKIRIFSIPVVLYKYVALTPKLTMDIGIGTILTYTSSNRWPTFNKNVEVEYVENESTFSLAITGSVGLIYSITDKFSLFAFSDLTYLPSRISSIQYGHYLNNFIGFHCGLKYYLKN